MANYTMTHLIPENRPDDVWEVVDATARTTLAGKANSASPALTGTPTAPTATSGTSSTQIATTAFVQTELSPVKSDVTDLKDDLLELEQHGYPMASIQEAVNAWADANEVEIVNPFVTPQMFGAKGDGATDDGNAFYDMFDWMIANDVSFAFIPDGTYLTSRSLAVPSGCTLIGTGYNSFIYLDTQTDLGVAITNGGSDVSIMNIRVGNIGDDSAIGASGYGGIGISVYSYSTVKNNALTEKANCSNIKLYDIYATGSYPVQVEAGNSYTISDVYINNVFAENGLVSVSAPSGAYHKNISIKNVVCDVLRVDYSAGDCEGINVSDVRANYIRLNSNNSINCSVKNALIETKSTSLYKATFNNNSALFVNGDFKLDNILITNNDTVTYGIYIYGGSSCLCNVKISNAFDTKNVESRVSDPQTFYNCDLGSANSTIFGRGYSTKATLVGGVAGTSAYLDDTTNFEISPTCSLTNASSDFPITLERIGNVCSLRMYKVITKVEKDDLIATIQNSSFRPRTARRIKARAFNLNGSSSYDIELTVNTDGKINVSPIYALTLSNYITADRLYINDMFLI